LASGQRPAEGHGGTCFQNRCCRGRGQNRGCPQTPAVGELPTGVQNLVEQGSSPLAGALEVKKKVSIADIRAQGQPGSTTPQNVPAKQPPLHFDAEAPVHLAGPRVTRSRSVSTASVWLGATLALLPRGRNFEYLERTRTGLRLAPCRILLVRQKKERWVILGQTFQGQTPRQPWGR